MMRAYNRVPDLRLGVKGQRAPREGFSEEVPYKLKIEEFTEGQSCWDNRGKQNKMCKGPVTENNLV